MSVAETISKQIEGFRPGTLFSYKDFEVSANGFEAVAAALSRLNSEGIIKRFNKGRYFKPQKGAFGEVPLKENQILDSILKKNNRLIGYLTGTAAYNKLGLTTQIANEYTVAAYEFRKPIKRGRIKIKFVKTYCNIIEKDIPSLQLLDAIKDIRNIPGTEPSAALELIKVKLKGLSLSEQKNLVGLVLNYPASTRALTGATLELLNNKSASEELFKSLNPLSKFKLGIKEKVLPNRSKWKIE